MIVPGRDFGDAIKEGKEVKDRTRGAGSERGYGMLGDTEGLPENKGRSRIAQ